MKESGPMNLTVSYCGGVVFRPSIKKRRLPPNLPTAAWKLTVAKIARYESQTTAER